MSNLHLSFACLDYDRMKALQTGQVRPLGIDLTFLALPVEETFWRQLKYREFDLSEMSLSSYVMTLDDPEPPFIALPVFPSRYFRHQSIYINARSGIKKPSDLVGKRVGVPEYQMTASVWQRGILAEHYGVPTNSMQYFTGGLEQPGRKEKLQLSLPDDISVTKIGNGETLNDMLVNGQIDAVTCASVPSVFREVDHIRRLFPNYSQVEKQYYDETGIFPIMHVVAIKRELYERHPWIASSLTNAFNASLERAYEDLEYRSALKTMLPWLPEHLDSTRAIMGDRFWSYGVDANRNTLETFLRYSYEQGLAKRRRDVDELFAVVTDGARI